MIALRARFGSGRFGTHGALTSANRILISLSFTVTYPCYSDPQRLNQSIHVPLTPGSDPLLDFPLFKVNLIPQPKPDVPVLHAKLD